VHFPNQVIMFRWNNSSHFYFPGERAGPTQFCG